MSESGRPSYPHVHQINVSDGGIPKQPVLEAKVAQDGVEGDRQQNLKVHGGPDRAVCLFSVELIQPLVGLVYTYTPPWHVAVPVMHGAPPAITRPFALIVTDPPSRLSVGRHHDVSFAICGSGVELVHPLAGFW